MSASWRSGRCGKARRRATGRLHARVASVGLRPRGRHHDLYIGDPTRSKPENLRTFIRQPVEPG